MQRNYLLPSQTAQVLYEQVRKLPIYDYHCHLSPKEIWEDHPFDNIGQMWLGGDHYKWRLMRAAGIPEQLITEDAPWEEKFLAYAKAVSTAAGNPLYHWTQMELSIFFGIETPLTPQTANEIWRSANRVIREKQLSPRKLMEQSRVAFVATTDDVADSLEYHRLLREDGSLSTVVTPSFRTDQVLLLQKEGYPTYIQKLSGAAGLEITGLAELKQALCRRMEVFCQAGCRFTDVGIPAFPRRIAGDKEADKTFRKALAGQRVSDGEADGFYGNLYLFLGREYRRRGLVMQWHLGVDRNVNSQMYETLGPDCGGDCIGDMLPGKAVWAMLDAIHREGGLPDTILYTLNPGMTAQLCSIGGSFPRVRMGAAWWFNDHKQGIRDVMETIAQIGHIGAFLGMLTDSRSFLSYARHDYFRRILCAMLGDWQESGEFSGDCKALAEDICCGNIRRLIEEVSAKEELA